MSSLPDKIRDLLVAESINFKEMDHAPTPTCEDSASARGEALKIGGKTLLLKGKTNFHLFTISAELSVDLKKVRKILGSGKLRLGTQEELWDIAGVEKGALPPFGHPILPLDLYADESIFLNDRIAFNGGVLTKSFIIDVADYIRIAKPIRCGFAKI